jgi:hypothetical protein
MMNLNIIQLFVKAFLSGKGVVDSRSAPAHR